MINELAEIQVSYSTQNSNKFKITTAENAFELFLNFWSMSTLELQEEFKIMFLNRANESLGIYSLSKGGTTGTIVDVKLLFVVALKCNASAIIICHNHPSGNLKPSEADISLTVKIKRCSEFLDIKLIDHLIITRNGYYSFSNDNML